MCAASPQDFKSPLQELEALMYSDPEAARRRLPGVRQAAAQAGDAGAQATAVMIMGGCAVQLGHWQEAADLAHEGLDLLAGLPNDALRARLLNIRALACRYLKRYAEALDTYTEALKYARLAGHDVLLVRILNNIAGLYSNLDYHSRALRLYEEIIEIAREDQAGFPEVFFAASISAANVHLKREAYQEVLRIYEETRPLSASMPEHDALISLDRALALLNLGQPQEALRAVQAVDELVRSVDRRGISAMRLSLLGRIYFLLGDLPGAETALRQSLHPDSGRPDRALVNGDYRQDTYLTLAQLHAQRGEYREAYENTLQYLQLHEGTLERDIDLPLERQDTHTQIELLRRDAELERQKNAELEKLNRQLLQTQEILAQQTIHDSLTGAKNREFFIQELESALGKRSPGEAVAVIFIDIDRFKAVNDNWGHFVGDQILRQVTARLLEFTREWRWSVVGRMGGDEFTVMLRGELDTATLDDLTRRLLDRLQAPFETGGQQFPVRVSVGYALAPLHGQTAAELQRHADMAMYHVKRGGGDGAAGFAPALAERYQRRQALDREMRGALERQEFTLAYQGRYAVRGQRLVGFEALLRWQSALGAVSPTEFIPLAEENRLIVPLGQWALRQACQQAVDWHFPQRQLAMSVNVSVLQFESLSFVQQVEGALRATGLPGPSLMLELTETMLLGGLERGAQTMRELRQLGVQIALDDFGVGYSSLSMLHELPFDHLKLDRTFFQRHFGPSPEGAAGSAGAVCDSTRLFLRVTVELAHALGLQVTAEGVEYPEHLALLAELNCDHVQGFLLGKPQDTQRTALTLAAL